MPKVKLISHEYDKLGDAIRAVMSSRHITTQTELARRMHESKANVGNWIDAAGKGNIKLWQLELICSAMHITITELFRLAAESKNMADNCMRFIG